MSNGKYCNQWTINSHKEKVEKTSGKQRPYLIAYTDTIINAARFEDGDKKMTGNTFMVWMWLLCNKEGSQIDYSPKYIAQTLGISEDSAKKAKTLLVEFGYLVPASDDNPFIYNFYDTPQPKKKKVAKVKIQIPVRYFKDDNDEYQPLTYDELAAQVRAEDSTASEVTVNSIWCSGLTSLE